MGICRRFAPTRFASIKTPIIPIILRENNMHSHSAFFLKNLHCHSAICVVGLSHRGSRIGFPHYAAAVVRQPYSRGTSALQTELFIEFEHNRKMKINLHRFAAHLAWFPFRHSFDHTQSLIIQILETFRFLNQIDI